MTSTASFSLSEITRGRQVKPPKIVVYGVGGIGKTTFAAGAPEPIVLPTEDGFGLLDVPRFPLIDCFQGAINALEALYSGEHEFKTVVVDSLTSLEPLLWKHTADMNGQADVESFGYGKGYTKALEYAQILLDGLDALRDRKRMAVVLIAHSQVTRFSDPNHEAYDRYSIRLQRQLADRVHDWSDAVLFANYQVYTTTSDDKQRKRTRAVGDGDRLLFTSARPAYVAKNRYGLPHELPLEWSAFDAAFAASRNRNNEPEQEHAQP